MKSVENILRYSQGHFLRGYCIKEIFEIIIVNTSKPKVFSQQGNNLRNSYQRNGLVWHSIIILTLLSKIVYEYNGKSTYAIQENTVLLESSICQAADTWWIIISSVLKAGQVDIHLHIFHYVFISGKMLNNMTYRKKVKLKLELFII